MSKINYRQSVRQPVTNLVWLPKTLEVPTSSVAAELEYATRSTPDIAFSMSAPNGPNRSANESTASPLLWSVSG